MNNHHDNTTISGISNIDLLVNYYKNSDMSGITEPSTIGTITVAGDAIFKKTNFI
jgi:hypothetical protein